jgi:hypothetical protein
MADEDDHPDVTLSDWQCFLASKKFCEEFPLLLIDEVADRDECGCLPNWFVPLARGVVIASDELLRRAGHHHGRHRPRGWREISPDCYWLATGWKAPFCRDALVVRRCDKHEWWAIQRRVAGVREVLVFNFGSTPIFTRGYASAMRLAMHCNVDNPPHGLRWIKEAADDCEAAIKFARKRKLCEVLCVAEARLPVYRPQYETCSI